MRPLIRRLSVVGAAVMLAVACTVARPQVAQAAPESSVSDFLGCMLGQQRGDLLMLFDTSGSMNETDPGAKRAEAATALVTQLANFAQADHVDLNAAIAGFGLDYEQQGGWSSLGTDSGLSTMKTNIGELIKVKPAYESDFWTALHGAQNALARQARAQDADQPAGVPRCQALLWFTDGAYHLTVRSPADQARSDTGARKPYAPDEPLSTRASADRATQRGIDGICGADGIADQLRSANVTIWGVGLSAVPNDPDLTLLERIARGEVEGQDPCGDLRTPPGQYFPVTDVNLLVQQIWVLSHPCAQNLQRFVLDDGLSRISLGAKVASGQGLTLVGPTSIGQLAIPADSTDGTDAFSASAVKATWHRDESGFLTVDVSRGDASWPGVWELQTSPGQPVDPNAVQVSLCSDILPTWPTSNRLIAGQKTDVRIGLARGGVTIAPEAVPGTMTVDAQLIPASGASVTLAPGLTKETLAGVHSADLSGTEVVGAASIRLTMRYQTKPIDGVSTPLTPQVVIVSTTVTAPSEVPPPTGVLDFGQVKGPAVGASASVTAHGPSCVWLPADQPNLVAPAELGTVTLGSPHNSQASCLQVDDGQTAEFPVQLTTEHGASGALGGTVALSVSSPDDPSLTYQVAIPAQAELSNPVDVSTAIPAFIIAFLLGLGIPIGLLYLFKWRGAMIPGRLLEAVLVPISVVDGEVQHAGKPLSSAALPAAQPLNLFQKGTRNTSAAGVGLQTRMGLRPFGAGYVEATLPGQVGASATTAHPIGKSGAAKLPLAVHNTWAVFHDPAGDPAAARLLVLRGFDLDAAGFDALIADARTSVAALLPGLHGLATSSGTLPGSTGPTSGAGFGLGAAQDPSGQPPATGGFGLGTDPTWTSPTPVGPTPGGAAAPTVPLPPRGADPGASPAGTPPAGAPPASGAPASGPTPPDPSTPPVWDSQSFGTFGLGTPNPPDDPFGERKAP